MIIRAQALPVTAATENGCFVDVPGRLRRIHTQATQATVHVDAAATRCASAKVQ